MPEKRKLHPSELELFIDCNAFKVDGSLKKGYAMCIARFLPSKGRWVSAHDNSLMQKFGSYTYPFHRFIVETAVICPECLSRVGERLPYAPVSNTGVGNQVVGSEDYD